MKTAKQKLNEAIEQLNTLNLELGSNVMLTIKNIDPEELKQIAEEYSLHLYQPEQYTPYFSAIYLINPDVRIHLCSTLFETKIEWKPLL